MKITDNMYEPIIRQSLKNLSSLWDVLLEMGALQQGEGWNYMAPHEKAFFALELKQLDRDAHMILRILQRIVYLNDESGLDEDFFNSHIPTIF